MERVGFIVAIDNWLSLQREEKGGSQGGSLLWEVCLELLHG